MQRGKYTFLSNESKKSINSPESRGDYGKKVSNTTINNYIRNIKVFFNYLWDYRVIRKNPVEKIKSLKAPRKPKQYVDDTQMLNLLREMDITKYPEFRDYIIMQLLFDTGMRVSECLDLLVQVIDLKGKAINLNAEITKAKKSRVVFFSPRMGELLRRWIEYKDRYTESDYLFPTKKYNARMQTSNFETNLKKYAARLEGIIKSIHH